MRWAIVALPIGWWVLSLLAYPRFLREADELVRKIRMQGAASGFWTGVWAGFGFLVVFPLILRDAGLPWLPAFIGVALMLVVMMVAYAIGSLYARNRYR
ncbi:MAG TPA: hypothetical protein VFY39_14345 [Gammaproteobacteria bacterium]|nr:hypothetical protein [Gammaproteobacteria bacterium]